MSGRGSQTIFLFTLALGPGDPDQVSLDSLDGIFYTPVGLTSPGPKRKELNNSRPYSLEDKESSGSKPGP